MSAISILDGGMGQELIARAGKATSLWSVQALLDNPELVRAVHDDFFAAGADVATTNSYSVLPDRLETHGILERLEELAHLSCRLACEARDAAGRGLVAGSLGPMGFSYQPDKAPPSDQAAEGYAPLARIHADYVDVHVLETMSSVDQARGGLMGASVTGKPVWLSVSVDDNDGGKLRSGEALSDLAPLVNEFKPATLLVNCSVPEAVTMAIPELVKLGAPVGAYANGFTGIAADFDSIGATVDILQTRTDLGPDRYAEFAQNWCDAGATMVGGCCEVGPAHIAELARRFGANSERGV
ncbi:Homocysteine S-methyltransferase [Roseovarius albus]|uniref:Homocysteine S-methyltransferase n=1 Tax=Roseovarius albus TaxID=1247867 RepID=A0A1X6ZJ96_9RHOB|nr:homocysteine S-methyltransferase family protein [Roseovarius albus]SLN53013.1 Homocysteine S-methyltransferase [Roseovarius albus]